MNQDFWKFRKIRRLLQLLLPNEVESEGRRLDGQAREAVMPAEGFRRRGDPMPNNQAVGHLAWGHKGTVHNIGKA